MGYLVRFADIGEVEASCAIGRVGRHARHPALVAFAAVRRVALVPDVDRDVLSLRDTSTRQHPSTAGAHTTAYSTLPTRLTLPCLVKRRRYQRSPTSTTRTSHIHIEIPHTDLVTANTSTSPQHGHDS